MEIAIFEDKECELKKAQCAVKESGNSCAVVVVSEHFNADETIVTCNRIIARRDDPNAELASYCCGLAQEGLFKVMEHIKNIGGGIITDMMFHLTSPLRGDESVPPSGLLIVMHALANGIPVVVCTDAAEVGGHHAQALHWIHDGYIVPAKHGNVLPFGWVENKDWDAAVKLLEQIHAQQKEVVG